MLLTLISTAIASDPVQIQLYYESLCPFCRQFITGPVADAWTKGPDFLEIANFTLVPYGNAKEKAPSSSGGSYTWECQHGARECQGNLVESCVLGLTNFKNTDYMPFIMEFEKELEGDGDVMDIAETVLAKVPGGPSYDDLKACYTSPAGNAYQHQMAEITAALNPPHQYVPWIVVDGKHDDAKQQACQTNLLDCVCASYTGSSELCKDHHQDWTGKYTVPTYEKIGRSVKEDESPRMIPGQTWHKSPRIISGQTWHFDPELQSQHKISGQTWHFDPELKESKKIISGQTWHFDPALKKEE